LGKKSRENREKHAIKTKSSVNYVNLPRKKKRLSNAKKLLAGLVLVIIIAVGVSVALSSQSPVGQQPTLGQAYPQNVAPVSYTTPTLSSDGNKVTIPSSYVNSSKLVFLDLKLKTSAETVLYQGRTVPLSLYRNGGYLPLVIISTPSGNTVAGIRICEPCGSFSFHIVKGANLKCDVCGAEWTLENFTPASGGCGTYPPPKLPVTVNGDNVEIDLSALQLQYSA
jgi:hypothetical protein